MEAQTLYRPRKPEQTDFYQCIEDHFETFEQVYDDRFALRYGFYRPYLRSVIYRFLDCGILHNGFARIRCPDCKHEYLLAFSCKRRHVCPSCHQKRVVEFGHWLCEQVIEPVPHRHVVLSLPKILRRYFLYDRSLLSDLSRCEWESLKILYQETTNDPDASPGVVVAIQSFGDLLNFNPHLHIIVSDGCFHNGGLLTVAPAIDTGALRELFRHKVLKLLLEKEKIRPELVAMMDGWRHSGFNAFCGLRIRPDDRQAMENVARYIIRASFSQERMTYLRDQGQVRYRAKDGSREVCFDALEWIAAMGSHVPDKGAQMVRYYGYYSNLSRGLRKKLEPADLLLLLKAPESGNRAARLGWAMLIRKIYEVDPLVCPQCGGQMKVIAFIEQQEVIYKILDHLGLWSQPRRPPPPALTVGEDATVNAFRHSDTPTADDYVIDPQYPAEAYF